MSEKVKCMKWLYNYQSKNIIKHGVKISFRNLSVIYGPESFVGVFVGPDSEVDAVLIEQLLQTQPVEVRNSAADQTLVLPAVVRVVVGAVHRAVAEHNDPGTPGAIRRGRHFLATNEGNVYI